MSTDSEDSAAGELSIVGYRRLTFSFVTQPAAYESAAVFALLQLPIPLGMYRLLTPGEHVWRVLGSGAGQRRPRTIPLTRSGLHTEADIEVILERAKGTAFGVVGGRIVLKKAPKKLDLRKWKGRCKDSLAELGYSSVSWMTCVADDHRDRHKCLTRHSCAERKVLRRPG